MMSKFTKLMTIIIIGFSLNACSTQRISNNEVQTTNKVAILSELDDHINKVFVGLTIFDNESTQSNIKAWNINQNIENDLAQKIWATGKEVVILQSSTLEIMQGKNTIVPNHKSYKNAQLVVIVKPAYQIENYPMFPEGYGIIEKTALGIKHRMLYASIAYEVYSAKDGSKKAYFKVNPEGDNILKLNTKVPFTKLTDEKMLALKPQIFELFDKLDTIALEKMGFISS